MQFSFSQIAAVSGIEVSRLRQWVRRVEGLEDLLYDNHTVKLGASKNAMRLLSPSGAKILITFAEIAKNGVPLALAFEASLAFATAHERSSHILISTVAEASKYSFVYCAVETISEAIDDFCQSNGNNVHSCFVFNVRARLVSAFSMLGANGDTVDALMGYKA